MHHHNNKRHAREEYPVQQRDVGAWSAPASHFSRSHNDNLTHSMHMTPGLEQLDAFYKPRALAWHRYATNRTDLLDDDRELKERSKRHHSDIDIQEQLVNDLVEKIELHRIQDNEAGTDEIDRSRVRRVPHAIRPDWEGRVPTAHSQYGNSIDYDTAQRCARAAIRMQEPSTERHHSIDYDTAQRCARSAIAMHEQHSLHNPTTSEMRHNAAHAAFRRLRDQNLHQQ
jgi:hypothetical protein